jgi:hypothetical protein
VNRTDARGGDSGASRPAVGSGRREGSRGRNSRRRSGRADERATARAVSDVVGVALLLAITTVSLSLVTAGAGTVVEEHAAAASADRVADAMAETLGPDGAAGTVAVGSGRFGVRNRSVRVLDETGVVAVRHGDALVYERGERRVAFVAGAVVRGREDAATLTAEPSIRAGDGVLLVGLPMLSVTRPDAAANRTGATIRRAETTHSRRRFDAGGYAVAVETATPGALEAHFAGENATTARRDFDGDGVVSVVARFPGEREAYLVVHRVGAEVTDG